MTLEQLLSLLRGAILNDRTSRVSGSSDYLWTDEELVIYMNEAQRRFATQGLVLRDGTSPEATRITLVAGQSSYDLHESVLAVLSARVSSQEVDLQRVGHSVLNAYRQPTESWIDPSSLTTMPPGAPVAFSTDETLSLDDYDSLGRATLRIHPVPSAELAGTIIQLRVVRKPIEQLQLSDLQASPEIPADHHLEMLDYAAYLALRIVDDDAGSVKRAADFKATFEENVTEARKSAMRKLFAPMDWGFGRGGYSWS